MRVNLYGIDSAESHIQGIEDVPAGRRMRLGLPGTRRNYRAGQPSAVRGLQGRLSAVRGLQGRLSAVRGLQGQPRTAPRAEGAIRTRKPRGLSSRGIPVPVTP